MVVQGSAGHSENGEWWTTGNVTIVAKNGNSHVRVTEDIVE